MTKESERLKEHREGKADWKKWGPYLSERQWGTVREDRSGDGNAWDYFTHEQSCYRAYRSGEDGIAGLSDDQQTLCFSLSLWNGKDPVLKERLFGLTNEQGNHGEDVKEYYFYLDSTPTHSYMKYLYKYPQGKYPYSDLVEANQKRSYADPEYELLDTGIFDEDRYFDVFIEYAKGGPDDLLIEITAHNRGPDPAELHLLPTLWFRNTWNADQATRPVLAGSGPVCTNHPDLGEFRLYCDGSPRLLFTENETNYSKLDGSENRYPYTKDGINNFIVFGDEGAVSPDQAGTKVAAHYPAEIPAGKSRVVRLRLTRQHFDGNRAFGAAYDDQFQQCRDEADEFYEKLIPENKQDDRYHIMRQAYSGMLWTKQYYEFDVSQWLHERAEDGLKPYNTDWAHMVNGDVISMPDKWEYPWYATWDLAFHAIALSLVDLDFAKEQLLLFLSDRYMHQDGQLPAYEWNFSDVNPPVHAFAVMFVHQLSQEVTGKDDVVFLKACFDKLSLNFNWWISQKDPAGKNIFEGGFLGLDNIGVFDRSKPLPTGGNLEQSDGTAWMVLFAQFMLQLSLEIAAHDESYDEFALKYLNHFIDIADMMDRPQELPDEMWDTEDGFFYDVLRYPDGNGTRLKVRSLVGLLPLCASTVIEPKKLDRLPRFKERFEKVVQERKGNTWGMTVPSEPGVGGRLMLSVLDEDKLRRIMARMLDENEFLSPFGIRSLSKFHEQHPYIFHWEGQEHRVDYLPGKSDSWLFGGNSNWRGPVWFPVNMLIIRSLLHIYAYCGDDMKFEYPTGSGVQKNLFDIATDLSKRLSSLFEQNAEGMRPAHGRSDKFQNDPHWKDYILFYEYFHADTGKGLGASHQTGWSGLVSTLMHMNDALTPESIYQGNLNLFKHLANQ